MNNAHVLMYVCVVTNSYSCAINMVMELTEGFHATVFGTIIDTDLPLVQGLDLCKGEAQAYVCLQ